MPATSIWKLWSMTASFPLPSARRDKTSAWRRSCLGWKIDIKSEEEKRQEVELQMSALVGSASTPLESVTGLGEGLIEKLSAAGVTTVESLADMTPEQLEAIEGIGPKTVEKISLAVNNYFASLESGEAVSRSGGRRRDPRGRRRGGIGRERGSRC